MKSKSKSISAPVFLEAEKLFSKLGLEKGEYFDNFCSYLSHLSKEEKKLLLSLTKYFYKEKSTTVIDNLRTAYISIEESKLRNAEQIIFMPLQESKKKNNHPKRESGGLYYNLFKNNYEEWLYYSEKFIFCDKTAYITKYDTINSLFVFIDDFIGSGTTVVDVVKEVKSYYFSRTKKDIDNNQIAIMVLVAMQNGVDELKKNGLSYGINKIFNKGITKNSQLLGEIPNGEQLMHSIEKKLVPKAIDKYSFGYMQSESLVSIQDKSPNNTFPVYWYGSTPIFPRFKKKT